MKNLQKWFPSLEGVSTYTSLEDLKCEHVIQRPYLFDFQDVQGQDAIIEFIVATAAGGHNLIMSGAPGCGKSIIAKRLPSISAINDRKRGFGSNKNI